MIGILKRGIAVGLLLIIGFGTAGCATPDENIRVMRDAGGALGAAVGIAAGGTAGAAVGGGMGTYAATALGMMVMGVVGGVVGEKLSENPAAPATDPEPSFPGSSSP